MTGWDKMDNPHRICIELAKGGLIKNEPWVIESVASAEEMFSPKALQINAMIFAALHPQAIHWLEQAPVLALQVVHGAKTKPENRWRSAARWQDTLRAHQRLSDLLKTLGIAKQLRKIDSGCLIEVHANAIKPLSLLNPSLLAQAIPDDPIDQRHWLNNITTIIQLFTRRGQTNNHFDWFVKHAREGRSQFDITIIGDFVIAAPERFNPAWSYHRALEVAVGWHEELARADQLTRMSMSLGFSVDSVVDYWPLPEEYTVPNEFGDASNITIVALRSGRDLIQEGKDMHHCVASYARDLYQDRCRLFSVRRNGKSVATFELTNVSDRTEGSRVPTYMGKRIYRWQPVQLKGPCNARVPNDVFDAVDKFLDHHRLVHWNEAELPTALWPSADPPPHRMRGHRAEVIVGRFGGDPITRAYRAARVEIGFPDGTFEPVALPADFGLRI